MVSIKEFFELREAGYSADQIKEYSTFIEKPAKDPAPELTPDPQPEPQPAQQPEQAPASAQPDPTAEQLKDVKDTLSMLIGTIRGMNINQLQMPAASERGVNEILAEIINPPKKQK